MPEKTIEKREILFIDDEPRYAIYYLENLKERFRVETTDNAESALRILKTNRNIEALILDVMMPSPKGVPDDLTAAGVETGLWLLQEIKDNGQRWPIPVMILTHRNLEEVRAGLIERGIREQNVDVRAKLETPAFTVGAFLEKHIAKCHST